jgi:hypothetical protein
MLTAEPPVTELKNADAACDYQDQQEEPFIPGYLF